MTHYELQVARNKKYADRTKVLIQTPSSADVCSGWQDHLHPRVQRGGQMRQCDLGHPG